MYLAVKHVYFQATRFPDYYHHIYKQNASFFQFFCHQKSTYTYVKKSLKHQKIKILSYLHIITDRYAKINTYFFLFIRTWNERKTFFVFYSLTFSMVFNIVCFIFYVSLHITKIFYSKHKYDMYVRSKKKIWDEAARAVTLNKIISSSCQYVFENFVRKVMWKKKNCTIHQPAFLFGLSEHNDVSLESILNPA